MENSTAKISAYLLLVLLLYMPCDAQDMRYCCKQKTCPCRLYDLLRGSGNHAAGILTLGKRKSEDQRFQSRLYQLLHASKNQAAGILTMGKRMEPNHSLYTHSTPSLTPHSRPDLKSCRPISAVESETKNVDSACCGPLSKLCLTRCTCST